MMTQIAQLSFCVWHLSREDLQAGELQEWLILDVAIYWKWKLVGIYIAISKFHKYFVWLYVPGGIWGYIMGTGCTVYGWNQSWFSKNHTSFTASLRASYLPCVQTCEVPWCWHYHPQKRHTVSTNTAERKINRMYSSGPDQFQGKFTVDNNNNNNKSICT